MWEDWSVDLNIIFCVCVAILLGFVVSWAKYGFFENSTLLLLIAGIITLGVGVFVERKDKEKNK